MALEHPTAEYSPTLPSHASKSDVRTQAEKDGTLRAGLRPRGYGTTNGTYPTGVLVLTTGTLTVVGEDGSSSGSITVPAGVLIIGPCTVTLGSATILGYK